MGLNHQFNLWSFKKPTSWIFLFLLCLQVIATAQPAKNPTYTLSEGEMLISIPNGCDSSLVDSLIVHYNLQDIGIKEGYQTGNWTKARQLGWVVKEVKKSMILKKSLSELSGLDELKMFLMLTSQQGEINPGYPVMVGPLGVNNFKKSELQPKFINDSSCVFQLSGFTQAEHVFISGSFNNWSTINLPLSKTNTGWDIELKIKPGKHLYKFIVDGKWMEDPNNNQWESDGFNGKNSVYYHTNALFKIPGYLNAKKVILAGNFNDWNERELRMKLNGDAWELPVYLEDGSYSYKFIVDGTWYHDTANPNSVSDGSGGLNSIITLGKPHLFRLSGYENAGQVRLAGDFNDWNPDELNLSKVDGGWELSYVLKPGNYTYKYIVDNSWILDSSNPQTVSDINGNVNSYLTIGANYRFVLKDQLDKKEVRVAGDFTNWEASALTMKRDELGWSIQVYLSPGKHLYKYIIDGTWVTDSQNPLWEENEVGTGNSVIWQIP